MAIVVIVLLLFQIVTQFVWLVEALKIVCPSLSRTSNFDYNSNSCSSYYSNCYGNNRRCKLSLYLLPKDIPFRADQIEILRILGKIDVQIDQFNVEEAKKEIEKYGGDPESVLDSYDSSNSADGRVTSVRIFEARIPGGSPCFLKEYLPIGLPFGRRELLTTRKLSSRFNELLKEKQENEDSDSDNSKRNSDDPFAPFPVLLGSLRPDARIEDYEFRKQWKQRFPRVAPPQKGNLWLVFQWDKTTFRTMKRYPPLPQIVEGLDYFNKDMRDKKRWRFVRKIMRKGLESLDYIHRSGFCHNSISSDSLWLTTTNQVEISDLAIKITDLGSAQRLVDLGPYGREGVMEDLYQLGFAFLELVISSFNDDNIGAQIARARLSKYYSIESFSL